MIRHIVLWNLKEENKEESAQAIRRALEDLNGRIPGMLSLRVYRGVQGCDLCLCGDFESAGALAAYRDNPLHKAAQRVVHAAMSERYSCDFELSPKNDSAF